jgi:hypothetical protein
MINDLKLHDATLLSIDTQWENRECSVHVDAADGAIILIFARVNYLEIPMALPWGSSVSINKANVLDGCWQIEMQSGDVITIKAADLIIKRVPNNVI